MKNKTTKTVTDSVFLDRNNKVIKVSDIVTEKDCWFVSKENRWAMSHKAVKKIAKLAGISDSYDVKESDTIIPEYKNELEHIVRVTLHCLSKSKGSGCVHNDLEKTITVTGEANRLNTPILGRGYLRKMAEKRAYDIAVLEHVGLYDTTFSEEESEGMNGNDIKGQSEIQLSNYDLETLRDVINSITLCKTKKELEKIIKNIEKDVSTYTKSQYDFLKTVTDKKILSFYDEDSTKKLF